jgi:diaminohydroxyphosphoribosylaminopyrimidine deaminase/5-amino-6-(5-phosphoribosylamino)uracil reductase
MVGAVLVKDGKIVGKGYHARAGTPHAEVVALKDAGEEARGATLYVTLEPCCHHGRTGPCTEAVIKAGVGKVVAAMTDPNPVVAGKGFARLREAGIPVEAGVLEEDARNLNEVFVKYITTGLPFVVMKAAVSLDGKIATRTGDSQWITGPEARAYGHRLRDRYDAVMVGINTVLADNPSLTTRLPGGGRDAVRVVLDSQARTPPEAKIVNSSGEAPVIILTCMEAPEERVRALKKAGARVVPVSSADGRVVIESAFSYLARNGITSVLIEGGGQVHASALGAGMVDKVVWFIAPLLIGGREAPGPLGGQGPASLAGATPLERVSVSRLEKDILVEGYISGQRG